MDNSTEPVPATEAPVEAEKPAEPVEPVSQEKFVKPPTQKKAKGVIDNAPTIVIKGLWTGRARDYDPKPVIEVPESVERYFYRIESSGSGYGQFRHLTLVYINGEMVGMSNGTIKEGDPTDTQMFDITGGIRVVGQTVKVVIEIQDWDRKTVYKSPEFGVKYV